MMCPTTILYHLTPLLECIIQSIVETTLGRSLPWTTTMKNTKWVHRVFYYNNNVEATAIKLPIFGNGAY